MTTEIEIIPPTALSLRVEQTRQRVARLAENAVGIPVLPGSPVKSGYWWAIITSRGNAFRGNAPADYVELILNGQTLQFPIGVWAVIDDNKFHVAKESDLPMMWFDGDRLMEKTIEMRRQGRSGVEYRVIGAREATSAPAIAAGPPLIEG